MKSIEKCTPYLVVWLTNGNMLTRQQAAFPLHYVTQNKFWPSVARVNNTHGDRNLICTCEPVRVIWNPPRIEAAEKLKRGI